MIERRHFLTKMAGLTAGIMIPYNSFSLESTSNRDRLGEKLPLRKLGKTGELVTMLGLGGYHIGWTTEKDAAETIETALEGGIRFFDTAEAYGPHTSEVRYGKYLTPRYRDEVFLMTKTQAKDAKTAQEHLEGSLNRLSTDRLDLWQAHAVTSKEDADARLKDGVFDYMRKMKQEGKVRYIGFTGHSNAEAHAYLLGRLKEEGMLDTVQMPVNPVDAAHSVSFVKQAMPIAKEQGYSILAMKTLAGGQFFAEKRQLENVMWTTDDPVVPGRFSMIDTLNFSWTLPISVLITGASTKQMIQEKIKLAKQHMALGEEQRQNLVNQVVDISKAEKVEYYRNRG